ncbi:MAG: DUF1206 domain-containing protein [Candidatus Competibacteraceae bacterium]|nr:DUF1206 domain-containing protein [Candidatus Competibacteraceae bacterium]
MAHGGSGVIEWLARLGYGARGLVYLIVGGLAFMDAFDRGGSQNTGTRGALEKLLGEPFGQALLWIVAVGLFGYALWRLIQSLADTDHHGTDAKGVAVRGGLFVSALSHIALGIFALSLIYGWGSGGGGGGTQDWTAQLMEQPFGRWLVGLVGLAVIGAGIAQFYKGAVAGFEKYMNTGVHTWNMAKPVSQFGLMAKGVVFMIIGVFLIVAAVQSQAGEAKGLKEVLNTLEQQSTGPWLLGIVAAGLFAFGIYSFIEAAYRRVNPPEDIHVQT